jgi:hypothetical protein
MVIDYEKFVLWDEADGLLKCYFMQSLSYKLLGVSKALTVFIIMTISLMMSEVKTSETSCNI